MPCDAFEVIYGLSPGQFFSANSHLLFSGGPSGTRERRRGDRAPGIVIVIDVAAGGLLAFQPASLRLRGQRLIIFAVKLASGWKLTERDVDPLIYSSSKGRSETYKHYIYIYYVSETTT